MAQPAVSMAKVGRVVEVTALESRVRVDGSAEEVAPAALPTATPGGIVAVTAAVEEETRAGMLVVETVAMAVVVMAPVAMAQVAVGGWVLVRRELVMA